MRVYGYALSNIEVVQIMSGDPDYVPLTSKANLHDKEPTGSRKVNFKDYSVLADGWLDDRMWPLK